MNSVWGRLKRRISSVTVEAAARVLVLLGLAWLFAHVWRSERAARRAGAVGDDRRLPPPAPRPRRARPTLAWSVHVGPSQQPPA